MGAVLCDLNLHLQLGKIHGLVGLNGSGKTTLLNALYGFVKYQQGAILFNGNRLDRRQIAYLETQNYFYSGITGNEYLRLFHSKGNSIKTDALTEIFGLPLDELVENYSSGMKKKLALLAVLKLDRELILLDEPFNNLDIETAHILKMVLKRINEKGKTIIVTSHIFESLTTICNLIHYLDNKRIVNTYTREQFNELNELLMLSIESKVNAVIESL
jgi:ABC-2 type transport system ATP-binding protein